jgi:hypothetical protein
VYLAIEGTDDACGHGAGMIVRIADRDHKITLSCSVAVTNRDRGEGFVGAYLDQRDVKVSRLRDQLRRKPFALLRVTQ